MPQIPGMSPTSLAAETHSAVAGGSSDDFDQRPLCHAASDRAVVDVERADCDFDSCGETEFFSPFRAQQSGGVTCVVGFFRRAAAEAPPEQDRAR